MKFVLLVAIGAVSAMDLLRTPELKAAELDCVDHLYSKGGYLDFKFTQKQDGMYINGSSIKHWVGPVKREWNQCIRPYHLKAAMNIL
jgi:hypothetical protein